MYYISNLKKTNKKQRFINAKEVLFNHCGSMMQWTDVVILLMPALSHLISQILFKLLLSYENSWSENKNCSFACCMHDVAENTTRPCIAF